MNVHPKCLAPALLLTALVALGPATTAEDEVPSCFGGVPDESDAAAAGFYVNATDAEVWIEHNQIAGLQRGPGSCVGANDIVVHYARDFFVVGAGP